ESSRGIGTASRACECSHWEFGADGAGGWAGESALGVPAVDELRGGVRHLRLELRLLRGRQLRTGIDLGVGRADQRVDHVLAGFAVLDGDVSDRLAALDLRAQRGGRDADRVRRDLDRVLADLLAQAAELAELALVRVVDEVGGERRDACLQLRLA